MELLINAAAAYLVVAAVGGLCGLAFAFFIFWRLLFGTWS